MYTYCNRQASHLRGWSVSNRWMLGLHKLQSLRRLKLKINYTVGLPADNEDNACLRWTSFAGYVHPSLEYIAIWSEASSPPGRVRTWERNKISKEWKKSMDKMRLDDAHGLGFS